MQALMMILVLIAGPVEDPRDAEIRQLKALVELQREQIASLQQKLAEAQQSSTQPTTQLSAPIARADIPADISAYPDSVTRGGPVTAAVEGDDLPPHLLDIQRGRAVQRRQDVGEDLAIDAPRHVNAATGGQDDLDGSRRHVVLSHMHRHEQTSSHLSVFPPLTDQRVQSLRGGRISPPSSRGR